MGHPAVSSFAWADVVVTLASPGRWLAGEVSRFLALPCDDAPGSSATADIIVTPERRITWRQGVEACCCGTDDDLVMATTAIVSLVMLERTTSIVLHAGAFVAKGHALLFSGPELVGKSSLALAAWRRGLPLMSDDWIVLQPDHTHVHAFPKPLKTRGDVTNSIESSTLKTLRAHVLSGRLMSGEWRSMYARQLAGMVGYGTDAPIGALFLLERAKGTQTIVEPEATDTALQTVLEQTMATRAPGLGGVKMLARLLADGAVFRCRIGEGDSDGAVERMVSACCRIRGTP